MIDYRWVNGRNEHLAEITAEFVRLKEDVIVTATTPPSTAAKQATRVAAIAATIAATVPAASNVTAAERGISRPIILGGTS